MGVFPLRQDITYTQSLDSIGHKRLTSSNQIAQVPNQEVEFVDKYMLCGGLEKNSPLIYRMTLVNMGKQNKQGYTGYTETLELTWVHRIYRGIQSIQYY